MTVKHFREIMAWQKAHELTLLTYKLTEEFPQSEQFCLTSQMRRAAISIPSNIAEGFKRNTHKDSIHFYTIAAASLEELKYQLLLSYDLGYITKDAYVQSENMSDQTGKLIYGWIRIQK